MPRTLPDPAPGYYEGLDGGIYKVSKSKAGNWYAQKMVRKGAGVVLHYVGHRVQLGERIEV